MLSGGELEQANRSPGRRVDLLGGSGRRREAGSTRVVRSWGECVVRDSLARACCVQVEGVGDLVVPAVKVALWSALSRAGALAAACVCPELRCVPSKSLQVFWDRANRAGARGPGTQGAGLFLSAQVRGMLLGPMLFP